MAENFRRIIHDHAELADALAELKNYRGISNETLEQICLFARGHVIKIFGPAREKTIGKSTLKYLLLGLAGRLVLELDPDQEKLIASRWERRNHKQVRVSAQPLSMSILQRAAPVIFSELARKSALARLTKIPPARRSRIARRAAKARWRRNGHATNGHARA